MLHWFVDRRAIKLFLISLVGCVFFAFRVSALTTNTNTEEQTADTVAPIISNISITNITSSTAVVHWSTDEKAMGQVEYGIA